MTLGTIEPHCSFAASMASIRDWDRYLNHTISGFNGVAEVQLKSKQTG